MLYAIGWILLPGYELDLDIIMERKENALIVPEDAVFEMDNKEYVFIVDNGKAALREVVTGIESQRLIQIIEGLKEGDLIILSPENSIKDGVKVK